MDQVALPASKARALGALTIVLLVLQGKVFTWMGKAADGTVHVADWGSISLLRITGGRTEEVEGLKGILSFAFDTLTGDLYYDTKVTGPPHVLRAGRPRSQALPIQGNCQAHLDICSLHSEDKMLFTDSPKNILYK